MTPAITQEHAESFLEAAHRAYLGIPEAKRPGGCNRHIFSLLLAEDAPLGTLEQLELSRSYPRIAAIDGDGTAITTKFKDSPWRHFVFSVNGGEIDDQLEEMKAPHGSVALSFSFEMLVKVLSLSDREAKPAKVRQTIVVLDDGRTMSLITTPGVGTQRAEALTGATMARLKAVIARPAA